MINFINTNPSNENTPLKDSVNCITHSMLTIRNLKRSSDSRILERFMMSKNKNDWEKIHYAISPQQNTKHTKLGQVYDEISLYFPKEQTPKFYLPSPKISKCAKESDNFKKFPTIFESSSRTKTFQKLQHREFKSTYTKMGRSKKTKLMIKNALLRNILFQPDSTLNLKGVHKEVISRLTSQSAKMR